MEQITRKCKICLKIKSLEDFPKSSRKYRLHTCKECDNNLNKQRRLDYNREYRKNNPERKKQWQKNSNLKRKLKIQSDPDYHGRVKFLKRESGRRNKVGTMWHNAKKRAIKNNLEFTITKEDIVIPEICPLLEVPFILGRGKDYLYTPTIDRIDINKGYTPDNIAVITMLANSMKNIANRKELTIFSKNIIKYIDKDIVRPIEKSIELEDKEPLG